ncbi:MAG: F0F1 ATP synthase subunit delta [Candidatus Omnitrophota bacterium]
MNVVMLILQFLILMAVVTGAVLFVLHRIFISSTDGALKRLDKDTELVRTKQAELTRKIKEAEEELGKRKEEADKLTKKMILEAEEAARVERDKIIKKARDDGEEIIAKAQSTKDKIRQEIEKETEIKTVDHAIEVLNQILSADAKKALDTQLVSEFIDGLDKVDMAQISQDIDTADVVSVNPLDEAAKEKLAKVIKGKLNREIKVNATVDPKIVGGVVLRFGSLALDGSLANTIKEAGAALKQKVEGE